MNPNKNVGRMSIFVMILALDILACQGASRFNPFATATPTPTATFTPSPTPSPTLTYTPTYTPTVTPLPTGRVIEDQPDGTTLFTDYDGHYHFTFPKGWTTVIFDKGDINQLLDQFPEQEKYISDMIETLKRADVDNVIRVIGFNFKAQQGGYTPNISVTYDTTPLSSALPLKRLLNATADYYSSAKIKVIKSEIKKTASGLEIGILEAQWTLNAPGGKKVTLLQKQILFKSGEGTVVITFTTLPGAKVDLSADIEKLIESIRLG